MSSGIDAHPLRPAATAATITPRRNALSVNGGAGDATAVRERGMEGREGFYGSPKSSCRKGIGGSGGMPVFCTALPQT